MANHVRRRDGIEQSNSKLKRGCITSQRLKVQVAGFFLVAMHHMLHPHLERLFCILKSLLLLHACRRKAGRAECRALVVLEA